MDDVPSVTAVEAPPGGAPSPRTALPQSRVRIGDVLWSLIVPGSAHGLAGRVGEMVIWAALPFVIACGILISIWVFPAILAVRLACLLDVITRVRRPAGRGNRMLALGALGIQVVGVVVVQMGLQAFKMPSSSMYPTLVIGDAIMVDKLTIHWRAPERGELIIFEQPCEHTTYVKRVIGVAGDTIEIRCNVAYVNGKAIPATLVESDSCRYDDRIEQRGWESRACSRYRETLDGHTFEIFHDADRPQRDRRAAEDPARASADSKDFPPLDARHVPRCEEQDGAAAPDQASGTIVETARDAPACAPQLHFVVPSDSLFVMGDNRSNSNDSRYWGVVPLGHVIGRVLGIYYNDGVHGRDWSRFGSVR